VKVQVRRRSEGFWVITQENHLNWLPAQRCKERKGNTCFLLCIALRPLQLGVFALETGALTSVFAISGIKQAAAQIIPARIAMNFAVSPLLHIGN
jgi:hypothetical protein